MPMELKSIIPMGRSLIDYRDMFALSDADLRMEILGCGDGPASFNAQGCRRGARIVSIDPLYAFSKAEIALRIEESFEDNFRQVRENMGNFSWTRYASVDDQKRQRRSAMDAFLADYETGKKEGRYREGGLPSLPFASGSFSLALSSHFLFLYSPHLDAEFHLRGILELLRVAMEVRVFPLVDLNALPSPHLPYVKRELTVAGFLCDEVEVAYEVQKGATRMLRVRRQKT
jgi:hypothetical protein